jgi:hypothetical protein
MRHAILLIFICFIAAPAIAQQINIAAEVTDEAALPRVMPRFAKAVIAFQQADQHPDLASLFKAQLVAGLYSDALTSLDKLHAPLAKDSSPRVRARYLHFRSMRLMSRELREGSRLVAVLSIVEPGREVNYGTGKEVIGESITDAKTPLQITWFGASYLDLPVHR